MEKNLLLKYLALKLLKLLKLGEFDLLFEQELWIIGGLSSARGRGGRSCRGCCCCLLCEDCVLETLHLQQVVEEIDSQLVLGSRHGRRRPVVVLVHEKQPSPLYSALSALLRKRTWPTPEPRGRVRRLTGPDTVRPIRIMCSTTINVQPLTHFGVRSTRSFPSITPPHPHGPAIT